MEQSYKEKYEQALSKAKDMLNYKEVRREDMEYLFPELAESKDEKIRKRLITDFGTIGKKEWGGLEVKDILAWLEKQGEKKPILDFKAKDWYVSKVDGKIHNIYHSVDKVEPIFKVGDWVVQGCNILKIRCVGDEYYCFETVGGYVDDMLVSEIDSLYHLWTIKDAMDGDVLVADSRPFIYNGSKNEVTVGAYCGFNVKNKFSFAYNYVINRNITPATKEQRDLLFQKINEAGYEWDAEKKELKKIEQKLAENAKPQPSTPMSYGKELEKRMYEACNRFFAPNTDSNRYSASDLFYAGVKAERDLNTLAWSEEDEPQKELAKSYLAKFDEKFPILPTLKGKQLADYKDFLNKCQQIFGLKYWGIRPIQAKLFEKLSLLWATWGAEHLQGLGQTDGDMDDEILWSEEDDNMLGIIISALSGKIYLKQEEINECILWLKSLRPQSRWKPSDEHIGLLQAIINEPNNASSESCQIVLKDILEQLKKLKEG